MFFALETVTVSTLFSEFTTVFSSGFSLIMDNPILRTFAGVSLGAVVLGAVIAIVKWVR